MSRHVEGQQKFCQIHRVWDFCEEDREYYHAEFNATIRDQRREIADLRRQLAEAQLARERAEERLSKFFAADPKQALIGIHDEAFQMVLNAAREAMREQRDEAITKRDAANALLRRAQEALAEFALFGAYLKVHPRNSLDEFLYGWDIAEDAKITKTGLETARQVHAAITAQLKP